LASYQNKVNEKSTFRPSAPRLMDQVREVLRYHHYGKRTEEAYANLGYLVLLRAFGAIHQFNFVEPKP